MAAHRRARHSISMPDFSVGTLVLYLIIGFFAYLILRDVFGGTLTSLRSFSAQLSPPAKPIISPLFTPSVAHWAEDLQRWGSTYNLDPDLLATVMQIESCGHPSIGSSAGAQGLFQVMPMHFNSAENQHDPDTNAKRGAYVLNECLRMAKGAIGEAMACYNGGPSVLWKPRDRWPAETQRYYRWGTGIYADALVNAASSPTLDAWLAAGGRGLCQMAERVLDIRLN